MTTADPQFEGVYGPYTITEQDRRDVQRYRLALLTSGLALLAGVVHCWVLGMAWAWLWMLPLGTGLIVGFVDLAAHVVEREFPVF